jgi:hypothetical protein
MLRNLWGTLRHCKSLSFRRDCSPVDRLATYACSSIIPTLDDEILRGHKNSIQSSLSTSQDLDQTVQARTWQAKGVRARRSFDMSSGRACSTSTDELGQTQKHQRQRPSEKRLRSPKRDRCRSRRPAPQPVEHRRELGHRRRRLHLIGPQAARIIKAGCPGPEIQPGSRERRCAPDLGLAALPEVGGGAGGRARDVRGQCGAHARAK